MGSRNRSIEYETSHAGCEWCANYSGTQPVNVQNFKCGAGEAYLKIYYCGHFEKRGGRNEV